MTYRKLALIGRKMLTRTAQQTRPKESRGRCNRRVAPILISTAGPRSRPGRFPFVATRNLDQTASPTPRGLVLIHASPASPKRRRTPTPLIPMITALFVQFRTRPEWRPRCTNLPNPAQSRTTGASPQPLTPSPPPRRARRPPPPPFLPL